MISEEKGAKGITLVALVITIIVLLILAGVTISMVMGENGIIGRASESAKATEIASIKEQIQMEILGKDLLGNITDSELETILSKYGEVQKDNDGNITGIITDKGYEIAIADIWNGTTVAGGTNEPTFTTVANAPDISGFNKTSTYYVAWDITSSPYAIDESTAISGTAPSNWYDYTDGVEQWANVKTTGGGNDCYWVWIPRYAYKVPTRSSAGTIDVKFLKDDTNIPIGESTEITNTTPTAGSWVVHPAFTFGDKQLTGIWVAKYEASSNTPYATNVASYGASSNGNNATDTVKVVPNVTSWRNITVNNIFTVCGSITKGGNSLGIGTNAENNNTNIDSHMMKNSEWGAVAYLSRSIYGKNGQVWNNPWAYDNATYYSPITGRANKSNDANAFLNGSSTVNYESVTDAYNTGNGPNASTTGNVYGVYDMAGGAWEYVAGYLSEVLDSDSTRRGYSQSLYDADPKYKDIYAGNNGTDTVNYELATNKAKYGDAVYETSTAGTGTVSWDTSDSSFPYATLPVFIRGGRAYSSSYAGVFAFGRYSGAASASASFRPVLVSPQ